MHHFGIGSQSIAITKIHTMKLRGKSPLVLALVLTAFLEGFILLTLMKTWYPHQLRPQLGRLTEETLELKDEHLSKKISKQPPETSESEVLDIKGLQKGNCCSIAERKKLEDLCPLNVVPPSIEGVNCSCTDYMLCKLVMLIAISSNHFCESEKYFAEANAKLPKTKVIVYDLGLKKNESEALQSYCNVQEVRKFKFDQYPGHVKDLHNYAWKPLLINEMSKDFELFFYCDSSCRVKKDVLISFLPYLLQFPFLPALKAKRSEIINTHDGMLKYFNLGMTREEMVAALPRGFQGGGMLMRSDYALKNPDNLLSRWVDCAMHVECIAPKGANRSGCNFHTKPDYAYVGCHRYDQSALNVIIIQLGGPYLKAVVNGTIPPVNLANVERGEMMSKEDKEKCNTEMCWCMNLLISR